MMLGPRNRPDREQEKAKFVYFARGLHSGLVKIGCSQQPSVRQGTLEVEYGEPVQVLFTEPGGFQKERGYHLRFIDHLVPARGKEWFHEAGNLHALLKRKGCEGSEVIYKNQIVEKVVELRPQMVLVQPKFVEAPKPVESRLVGYARVSTDMQSLEMQLAMLKQAGVKDEDLFTDKLSATNLKRPYFNLMLKHVYLGDTLLIYSMSRMAREVRSLFAILDELKALGVTVKSLTEPHLDLTTSHGRLMMTITAAIDQNERERLQSRTKHGMSDAKRRGMAVGAPKKVTDEASEEMNRLRHVEGWTLARIAKKFKVSSGTVAIYTKQRAQDDRAA